MANPAARNYRANQFCSRKSKKPGALVGFSGNPGDARDRTAGGILKKKQFRRLAISLPIFANQVERGKRTATTKKRRFSMRLKRQLTRLMVVGGLAVMTTGISQAGGGCWCGGPQPKAISQPVTAQPNAFSAFWTMLLALI
jgi:hypothetical protein